MPNKQSICIITPDLVGLVRNGGVGTACTELAKALAASGHNISILFSQVGVLDASTNLLNQAKQQYAQWRINLIVAEEWAGGSARIPIFPPHPLLQISRIIHEWLKHHKFDLVLFMDWQGNGFYPLTARRAGLAHTQHGAFVVVCHGPTLWSDLGNAVQRRDPLDALTYFIERRSIEMADAVISPSRYLLEWLRNYGFQLPKRTLIQPNLLETEITVTGLQPIEEVVFFGRLEYRKGIVQFCSAIDDLIMRKTVPRRVVFLGKFGFVGDEHAALYLARRIRNWPMPVEIVNRLNQPEALRFLATRHCLAVVPSIIENSPYTVYECLLSGIPVIARDVGGICELYAYENHDTHLFGDNPAELADRIVTALNGYLPPASLSFLPHENCKAWIERLPSLVASIKQEQSHRVCELPKPFISVCMTHYRRPRLLLQALQSMLVQTYPYFEVVLVDDGSADAETEAILGQMQATFQIRGWTIIWVKNGFPGRARNVAVTHARGDYLLFMDDDNVAVPHMIESLVKAATYSRVAITTSFASVFNSDESPHADTRASEYYLPVGGGLGYALSGNAISDTNALIHRSIFNTLDGFTEDYGVGHEDFELFLKTVLLGADIIVIPETLYWYRRHSASVTFNTLHAANRARSFRPFLNRYGPDMNELLVVAHGMAHTEEPSQSYQQLEDFSNEKAILSRHDPDSWQAIDCILKILTSQGDTELILQLLSQLSQDTIEYLQRNLRIHIVKAARSGNLEGVTKIIEQIMASAQIEEINLRDLFYLAVRVAIQHRQSIATDLLGRWIRLDPKALEPRLLLVEAFDALGRTNDALDGFVDVLKMAEAEYYFIRPDVDAAVSLGEIDSGLAHYVYHGYLENTSWPQVDAFRRIATRLHASLNGRPILGSTSCIQTIRLAFERFAGILT